MKQVEIKKFVTRERERGIIRWLSDQEEATPDFEVKKEAAVTFFNNMIYS